jgi:hypothetical protein
VAVLVTIVFVAYILVPTVARFFSAASGYDPTGYEPKDAARQSWLDSKGRMVGLPNVSWETLINVGLFLMVVIVWLALVPPDRRRHR